MSEIDRILNNLPSQLRHQGELEELKGYARCLEQQNKSYREAVLKIRDINNDTGCNYEIAKIILELLD